MEKERVNTPPTLADLLHPDRIRSSTMMYAIIGTILGENWVRYHKQQADEFKITPDSFVICGGWLVGSREDFERNVREYIQAGKLPIMLELEFWEYYRYRVIQSPGRLTTRGFDGISFVSSVIGWTP
jgi:hypothetical protein